MTSERTSRRADGRQGRRGRSRPTSRIETSRGATAEQQTVQVNTPLEVDGAKAFLVGHGYAPVIQVKDAKGQVIYDAATVFLPIDGNFTSNGVIKMPDNNPQLAMQAIFTRRLRSTRLMARTPHSCGQRPGRLLVGVEGESRLDNGVPQRLQARHQQADEGGASRGLRPGETWTLPDGLGSVTFTGIKQYATFDIAHDPGKEAALIAAVLAILGLSLSLFIPRRRVGFR